MPSIRTLIPLVGFSLALLQGVVAGPLPLPAVQCTTHTTSAKPTLPAKPTTTPTKPTLTTGVAHAATPALPTNGGGTELPAPSAGLKLLHVGMGKGTQNYSCSAVGAVPASDGALATLYDVTSLAYTNVNAVHQAPPKCVMIPGDAVPKGPVNIPGIGSFPILAQHFFTPAPLTPTFDLASSKQFFSGKAVTKINAPAGAGTSPNGAPAVQWLQLSDSGLGLSVGVSEAYRVVTAGGSAPATCTTTGIISVPYCAEYWFYG